MKLIPKLFSYLIISVLFVNVLTTHKSKKSHLKKAKKNKQLTLVDDRSNFGSNIDMVVRKSPSVYVENKFEYPRIQEPANGIYFSNSNTSSQPNIGGWGKTAEIVNPTILFHSKEPVSVVEKIPAHLGYRNVDHTYTAFNRDNKQFETHKTTEKEPIYGEINAVKTYSAETIKPFDLVFNRFRKPETIVRENPEFQYSRNMKYPD